MLKRDLLWVYEGQILKDQTPNEEEINHDDDHEWLKEGFLPGQLPEENKSETANELDG